MSSLPLLWWLRLVRRLWAVVFLILKFNVIFRVIEHIVIRELSKGRHHLSSNLWSKLLSFLIPTPLINLGFWETSLPWNFKECFFGPIRVPIKLSHQNFNLICGLSLSLSDYSFILPIVVDNIGSAVGALRISFWGVHLWVWVHFLIRSHTFFIILVILLFLV